MIDDRADIPWLSDDAEVRTLREVESDLIRRALIHYAWSYSHTARALGIGRSTLYRKMREYKIKRVARKRL